MANTIQNISLSNTFAEWVSTTVQTVNELNYIGDSDWHKPTGTMFLDSDGTSLDVANNAYFRNGLIVTGIGSSLSVQKNGAVGGVLYLTNNDTGANRDKLIFSANGVANINYVNIVGTGLAANVLNDMAIGGMLNVTGNTYALSDLIVSQDITGNNQTIVYDLNVGEDATVGNTFTVVDKATLQKNVFIGDSVYVTQHASISGNTTTHSLQANTVANTRTLSVTGTASVNNLQANTAANTRTLSVTGTTSTDYLQANTAANTGTLSVTGTTSTDYLQANTAANTTTLSVVGTASVNNLQANTAANTTTLSVTGMASVNNLQANTAANTRTLSVTGTASVDNLQANTAANTGTLSVTGTASVNTLQANTLVNTPSVNTNILVTNSLQSNSSVNTAYVNTTSISISTIGSMNYLQANTAANTTTLSVVGTASVNTLQANTLVNTPSVNTSILVANNIQANSSTNTTTLSVVGTASVNNLQANTAANTRTLSVTGTTSTDYLQANTAANTRTLSVTGTTSTGDLVSNNNITTVNLNASGKVFGANVISNTSIISPFASIGGNISVGGVANVNQLTSNTNIVANSGTVWASVISAPNIKFTSAIEGGSGSQITSTTGNFTNVNVSGNFVINNPIVSDADTYALKSISPLLPGSGGYGQYTINRGESTNSANANASIRWDNTNKYWAVRDVDNPLSTGYSRILNANDYTTLSTSISTANTNLKSYVDNGFQNSVNGTITTANTNNILYTNAQISANAVSANAVITQANSAMKTYVDATFVKGYAAGSVQTITSDVTVTGNLTINGTTTTVNTTIVETTDSLLKLAKNNGSTDSIDIGFYAPYQTGGQTRYTGLFRKAADKYYLGQAIITDPTANSITNYGVGYRATLDGNFTGGTVSGLASAIPIADGGTNATTFTASQITYFDGTKLASLANTGTAGTYGSNAYHPVITTDAYGRVSGVSNTAIGIDTSQVISGILPIARGGSNNTSYTAGQLTHFDGTKLASLANTGTAGTYGSNAYHPVITTDALGRVSGVSNTQIGIDASQIISSNLAITRGGTNANTFVASQITYFDGTRLSSLANTGTAGTYGSNAYHPVITTDAYGRVSSVSNTAIGIDTSQVISGILPIARGGSNNTSYTDGALLRFNGTGFSSVANTGTAGTYGSNAYHPVITTDAYGRVSGVSNTAIGIDTSQVISGILPIARGGSNNTTYTSGQLVQFDGTKLASLANTGTAGTYGSNAYHPVITTDALGRVSGVSNTAIGIDTSQVITGILPVTRGGSGVATITGLIKGTGATAFTAASAGTDYAPATSGSSILKGNGSGGFSSASAGTDYIAPYSSQTANFFLAAPNGSAGTPSFRAIVAADIPTLNQATTSSAGTFTSTTQNSQFNSVGVGTAGSAVAGEIRAANNITAYYSSDRRLKENIEDIPGALDIVNHIGGKLFDWTDDYITNHGGEDGYFIRKSDFGVIAQDVQEVFDVAIRTREDGYLAVDYEKMCSLAFAAIKELSAKVDELQKQIDTK